MHHRRRSLNANETMSSWYEEKLIWKCRKSKHDRMDGIWRDEKSHEKGECRVSVTSWRKRNLLSRQCYGFSDSSQGIYQESIHLKCLQQNLPQFTWKHASLWKWRKFHYREHTAHTLEVTLKTLFLCCIIFSSIRRIFFYVSVYSSNNRLIKESKKMCGIRMP